uniref:Laminin N-terminal domain-containing protein n=1 Tax=Meloidogyne hapla TaxID=6305 RepID=A0A1I8AZB1_MELHA
MASYRCCCNIFRLRFVTLIIGVCVCFVTTLTCSSSSDGRSSSCVSPPTYSVECDESGKLISGKYQAFN